MEDFLLQVCDEKDYKRNKLFAKVRRKKNKKIKYAILIYFFL